MVENSNGAHIEVDTFFDNMESLLYLEDIPEDENILQSRLLQYNKDSKMKNCSLISTLMETRQSSELYDLNSDSHKIYSSARQYLKAKTAIESKSNNKHVNSEKNVEETKNQCSDVDNLVISNSVESCFSPERKRLRRTAKNISSSNVHCKSICKSSELSPKSIDGNKSLSMSVVDPLVSEALKNSEHNLPRVCLTNIFENNNVSYLSHTKSLHQANEKVQNTLLDVNNFDSSGELDNSFKFPDGKSYTVNKEPAIDFSEASVSNCQVLLQSTEETNILKNSERNLPRVCLTNIFENNNVSYLSHTKSLHQANEKVQNTLLDVNNFDSSGELDNSFKFPDRKSFTVNKEPAIDFSEASVSNCQVLLQSTEETNILKKRVKYSEKNLSECGNVCNKTSLKRHPIDDLDAFSQGNKIKKKSIASIDFQSCRSDASNMLPEPKTPEASMKKVIAFKEQDTKICGVTLEQEVPKRVSRCRKNMSFIDMLKRYSEKGPETKNSPLEEKSAIKKYDDGLDDLVENTKSCISSLEGNDANIINRSSLSLSTGAQVKDEPHSPLVGKSKKETQEAKVNAGVKPLTSMLEDDHCNIQNNLAQPEESKESLIVPTAKRESKKSVITTRMQTRIQTKSLISKNVKDLLNGKIYLRDLAQYSTRTKRKFPKTYKSSISDFTSETSSETDKISVKNKKQISPSEQQKIAKKEKYIARKSKLISSIITVSPVGRSLKTKTKNLCIMPPNYEKRKNGEQNSCDFGENTVPNLNFSFFEQKENNLSSFNNSIVKVNSPYMQLPSQLNPSIFSMLNQFPVQNKPYYVQFNNNNFPMSSFPSSHPVTYCVYQSSPVLDQSNASAYKNINSILSNGSYVTNTASNVNFPTSLAGNRQVPMLIHNSITSCTNTKTKDTVKSSKLSNDKGLELVKDIVNSGRKLCVYDICDSALRFVTENELLSEITVKEFCSRSPLAEVLKPRVFEEVTDFDDSPKVEYVFEDNFENNSVREVIKDYVAFHLDAFYKNPASKDYFIKKAFKNFSFRDCSYLCEMFPKDNEILNYKDLILFLSCSALFIMFDEVVKKNIMH